MDADRNGLVHAIQHFCLHDGPGVRSTVFFKGCPLRCAWCHNPESQQPTPELAFKGHLCVGCGVCVDACDARTRPGLPELDRCGHRFECVRGCPAGALVRYGDEMSVQQVLDALSPEMPLLSCSGGGVTLSGGEPTLQPAFAAALAAALGEEGVHVALQTCGEFDAEDPDVQALLARVDLVLFDLKLADPEAHRRWTGRTDDTIAANLRRLCDRGDIPVWPRIPLVPGVNDTPKQLDALAERIVAAGLSQVTLVPYHPMGRNRSAWLGRGEGAAFEVPDESRVATAREHLVAAGLEVFEPGEES